MVWYGCIRLKRHSRDGTYPFTDRSDSDPSERCCRPGGPGAVGGLLSKHRASEPGLSRSGVQQSRYHALSQGLPGLDVSFPVYDTLGESLVVGLDTFDAFGA